MTTPPEIMTGQPPIIFTAWVIHDAEAIYVAVNVTDDNVVTDTAEAGSEDQATREDDSIETSSILITAKTRVVALSNSRDSMS
jgi:hypothetical protein